MKLWPHQVRTLAAIRQSPHRRICVQGPTGCGKSRVAVELAIEAAEQGQRVLFLTHRRMLGDQWSNVLEAHGIAHGRRAAGHLPELGEFVQLSSVQTEESRVYKRGQWALHAADLVLVDECHALKSATAAKILTEYDQAKQVSFSATPYDVGRFNDVMIRVASMEELRACGALVPAHHYGPNEPDTRHIKRTVTGEYTYRSVTRVISTQILWGHILDWWRRLNPEGYATLVFAPGVAESRWLAQQFQAAGIVAAHIDGESVWCDGQELEADTASRDMVAEGSREGHIQVVCNRYVLREGIDWPWIRFGCLATVFGSPQSYVQSCGRLLRASPGKDHATLLDFGGNWWRHGSVNHDRQWDLESTVNQDIGERARGISEGEKPEPIVCRKCCRVRSMGRKCPHCGHESPRRVRMVLQTNGKLIEHAESCFPHRPTTKKDDTQELWSQMYWRFRQARRRPSFRQAYGFFVHTHRYRPPLDMKYMPRDPRDWYRPVADVPKIRLCGFELQEYEK